ncbi:MAG: DUF2088 domain-containing protein [Oscillospiraceae bacterium]|nr:DUF2088 domain-containing protein [Oscillospiraceae bacterium]
MILFLKILEAGECVDKYENYHLIAELLRDAYIPRMALVRQNFPRPRVADVPARVRALMSREDIRVLVKPGESIAVTCGSRGIANIRWIIREVCQSLLQLGARPFIVPAMGSHGGATAAGQRAIIEGYGVTEEFCGAPIRASMEVKRIGETADGRLVCIDRNAAEADGIVVVGRVKPHTDFRGPYESGLMKMMVIGLGKQRGAETFHKEGPAKMGYNIPMFGKAIIQHAPIRFGIAILENAYDETARIEIMRGDEIADQEPMLLQEAKSLMARSYIENVDLLIIDQIGKDISGDGMDPNITGRFCNPYISGGMCAKKMAILDLSCHTHGQMAGLGYGDVTTKRCLEKCDFIASFPNALTSTTFTPFRVPMVLESDRDAIAACLKYNGGNDILNPRVIRIHDTMHMDEIWVSEALLDEVEQNPNMQIIRGPEEMRFHTDGNLW